MCQCCDTSSVLCSGLSLAGQAAAGILGIFVYDLFFQCAGIHVLYIDCSGNGSGHSLSGVAVGQKMENFMAGIPVCSAKWNLSGCLFSLHTGSKDYDTQIVGRQRKQYV